MQTKIEIATTNAPRTLTADVVKQVRAGVRVKTAIKSGCDKSEAF
jgi:hypothetical protein